MHILCISNLSDILPVNDWINQVVLQVLRIMLKIKVTYSIYEWSEVNSMSLSLLMIPGFYKNLYWHSLGGKKYTEAKVI